MFKCGDIVRYKTGTIRTIHNGEKLGVEKTGTIEEAFYTVDRYKLPCYWIVGEKELILDSQILGKVES